MDRDKHPLDAAPVRLGEPMAELRWENGVLRQKWRIVELRAPFEDSAVDVVTVFEWRDVPIVANG